MDLILLLNKIFTATLSIVILIFTVVSILRITKLHPPEIVKQYLISIVKLFFILIIPFSGYVFIPGGSDPSIIMMTALTLAVYYIFYIFMRAFNLYKLRGLEVILMILTYIQYMTSGAMYMMNHDHYKVAMVSIIFIQLLYAIGGIIVFYHSKSLAYKNYIAFLLVVVMSTFIGLSYNLYIREFWYEFVYLGRMLSLIGFNATLILIIRKYMHDCAVHNYVELGITEHNFVLSTDVIEFLENCVEEKNSTFDNIIMRAIQCRK